MYSLNNDVFGQTISNGSLSGSAYAIAQNAGYRESTPAIACSSITSCIVPYRSLDPWDTYNPVDRIKARLVSYP